MLPTEIQEAFNHGILQRNTVMFEMCTGLEQHFGYTEATRYN